MRIISLQLIWDDTPIKLYTDEFWENVLENDMITGDMDFIRILTLTKTGKKDRKIFMNKSRIESLVVKDIKEESDL